jgi:hypothetical protein
MDPGIRMAFAEATVIATPPSWRPGLPILRVLRRLLNKRRDLFGPRLVY